MQSMNIAVDVQGKMFKSCVDENFYYKRCDLKPTPTVTATLTLALGLRFTPRKTISVENLKPNSKHEYRRRRAGKNV